VLAAEPIGFAAEGLTFARKPPPAEIAFRKPHMRPYSRPATACLVILAAASSIGHARAEAETIATFTKSQTNPVFRGLRVGAETAAVKLGARVMHYIPRSETIPDQMSLLDEVARNKPDAVVLAPGDGKALLPAAEKLTAAGIPITNVNERLAGGSAVAYVGTDDYELARVTGRFLLQALGGKGNVVILEGPEGVPTSIARTRGFNDALKEFPEVKLVATKSANYARTPAAETMKGLLRSGPQIDGVLAANDPMAIGAVEALKSAGKKAAVIGINASKEVLDLVKAGDVIGSGDYNGFTQGCLGAEIAIRNLRKQPMPKEVLLQPVVVDKTNYEPYEVPVERRPCPSLDSIAAK
jgi:ribose transport system substrate-binding protein